MVVIVPVNPDVKEAQHVAEENRQQRAESAKVLAVRHLHFQHHNGDDDGDNAVTERLKATLAHYGYSTGARTETQTTSAIAILRQLRSGNPVSAASIRILPFAVHVLEYQRPTVGAKRTAPEGISDGCKVMTLIERNLGHGK